MSRYRTVKERRAQVLLAADGTQTQAQIARKFGVKSSVIREDLKWLRKQGHQVSVKEIDRGRISPVIIRKIRDLHAEGGLAVEEIARRCGVSHVTVTKYRDPPEESQKNGVLPDLPSPDFTYEVVTRTSRTRHTSFTKERAQSFALSLCRGREIVSQGFLS